MSDAGSEFNKKLSANLLVLRIVVGVLITSPIVLLVVAFVVRAAGNRPPSQPVVGLVGVFFAAGALCAYFIVPKSFVRSWQRQIAGGSWPLQPPREGIGLHPNAAKPLTAEEEALRWLALYQSLVVTRSAFLEGAAFLQGIAYLVEGNVFSLGIGVVLVIALLLQWPDRVKFESWVKDRVEAVEQLQRERAP
jgi:hypothetical protein